MHETSEDLAVLQDLLDRSYAGAGEHLKSILLPEKRLSAEQLSEMMTGMQLLTLATVNAAGEPRVGAVDGHFHRGAWHFGSSHESVRFRHLRARPAVSAAHVRGEELTVVVHGRAVELDLADPAQEPFLRQLADFYGGDWVDWGKGAAYARIEASTMFAAYLPLSGPST